MVTVFLLLPVESAAYTFSGWTVNGSFTCHCDPDVQCDAKTGACPGGVCGIQQADHPWGWGDDPTCQTGDVALSGTAYQTGDSVYTAQRCIAGYREYNETLYHLETYCHPHRADGQLSWSWTLARHLLFSTLILAQLMSVLPLMVVYTTHMVLKCTCLSHEPRHLLSSVDSTLELIIPILTFGALTGSADTFISYNQT